MDKVTDLLSLLLPRFVQEGKKYASVAVGCTGGKHRSVHIVQMLAERLQRLLPEATQGADRQEAASPSWRVVVTHRELMRSLPGGALRATGSASGPDVHAAERVPGAGGLTDIP